MSGNEIIGKEELNQIKKIFTQSNGVLFAHGFDKRRNNIFRTKIFEKNFAKYLRCKYAVSCSSGTAAGTLALMSLGIKPGDEVITQAFTFIAVIESILMAGASPIIVDTDDTLGMCPKDLEKKINKKTKCIIPVHMLGYNCDMKEIIRISKKRNIPIIEDACESLGTKYKEKYSGTLGKIGFYSLDFGKIITTGEGGMIVTNSKKIYYKLKALRDHGHENKKGVHRGLDKALLPGFNFRMTELQAAVGLAQLKKLEKILRLKKKNFTLLKNILKKNNHISFRKENKNHTNQCDYLCIQIKNKLFAKKYYRFFLKKKLPTGILPVAMKWHFAGNWNHIWKKQLKNKTNYQNKWGNCKNLLNKTLSIPISIKSSQSEMIKIGSKINSIIVQ